MDKSKDFDFIEAATKTERQRTMKVPGEVPAVGKMSFEIQKLREELKTKTVPQLKEALERQEKLVKNPALLKKLPDKGEKSLKTVKLIKELISEKEEVDGLEKQMKALKVNTEKMEWKGGILDSDDDSDPEAEGPVKDPLSLLAQGVVPKHSSKAAATTNNNDMSGIEAFAVREAEKVDGLEPKQSFVPFKNTKTSTVTEDIRKLNPKSDKVETVSKPVSSKRRPKNPPTPSIPLPNTYTCETKQLSLTESLKLQQDQDKKLREIQMKNAAEKLSAGDNFAALLKQAEEVNTVGSQFEEYRDQSEEVEDVDEDEEAGVNIMSVVNDDNNEE